MNYYIKSGGVNPLQVVKKELTHQECVGCAVELPSDLERLGMLVARAGWKTEALRVWVESRIFAIFLEQQAAVRPVIGGHYLRFNGACGSFDVSPSAHPLMGVTSDTAWYVGVKDRLAGDSLERDLRLQAEVLELDLPRELVVIQSMADPPRISPQGNSMVFDFGYLNHRLLANKRVVAHWQRDQHGGLTGGEQIFLPAYKMVVTKGRKQEVHQLVNRKDESEW